MTTVVNSTRRVPRPSTLDLMNAGNFCTSNPEINGHLWGLSAVALVEVDGLPIALRERLLAQSWFCEGVGRSVTQA